MTKNDYYDLKDYVLGFDIVYPEKRFYIDDNTGLFRDEFGYNSVEDAIHDYIDYILYNFGIECESDGKTIYPLGDDNLMLNGDYATVYMGLNV